MFYVFTERVSSVRRWQAADALAFSQRPGKRVCLEVLGGGGGIFSECLLWVYDSLDGHIKDKNMKNNNKNQRIKNNNNNNNTNNNNNKNNKTAAVLVPPGQELTWTFSTPEGNQEVSKQLAVYTPEETGKFNTAGFFSSKCIISSFPLNSFNCK